LDKLRKRIKKIDWSTTGKFEDELKMTTDWCLVYQQWWKPLV